MNEKRPRRSPRSRRERASSPRKKARRPKKKRSEIFDFEETGPMEEVDSRRPDSEPIEPEESPAYQDTADAEPAEREPSPRRKRRPRKERPRRRPPSREPLEAGPTADSEEVAAEEEPPTEEEPPAEKEEEFEELARARRREAKKRPPRERRKGGARRFPLAIVIIIAAFILTLVLAIMKTRLGKIDYSDFVFFLVIYTIAAHLNLKLKGGGTINLGIAVVLAALVALPPVEVVWLYLLGNLVVLVTRMIGEVQWDYVLARMIEFTGVGLMAVIYYWLVRLFPDKPLLHGNYAPYILISAAFGAAVFFLFLTTGETYVLSEEGHIPAFAYLQSVARKSWLPYLILGFTGVLMGLVFLGIGMWSVLIALPLLLVFLFAYNRVAETDKYLLETIRVLSSIPEKTGMIPEGHAERVATLSAGVARELGLSPEATKQVEYAAYLQDIGVVANPPEPEGEQKQLLEVEGVIEGGVDIVGKVEYLEVAAEILRGREGLGDRVVDAEKRRTVSMGAGILTAVDDFESLVQGMKDREPMSENDALTEMNLERGIKYDSKVLRAIARVLSGMKKEGLAGSAEGSPEGPEFWEKE